MLSMFILLTRWQLFVVCQEPFTKKMLLLNLPDGWSLEHGVLAKKQNLFVKLLRYSINKATFYQATSKEIVSAIKSNGLDENKIKLIPNAVDTARFSQPDDKLGLRTSLGFESELIGVFVGRLSHRKKFKFVNSGMDKYFC